MTRASSPENKDKKKKKKSSEKRAEALLSLKAEQKKKPVPAAKSLNSLKKIQSQLDRIVKQRNKEKKYVKKLKNTTQTIAAQLDHIESRFPGLALNIELKQVKTVLKEKTTELQHNTDKLTREISIFRDLMGRVEDKILAIEKDTGTHKQQIQNLKQSQAHLFEKISLFEKEVNKFSAEFVQPEQTAAEFTEQLNQLNQVVTQINQNHQQYDTQIKLLQTDTGNIRKSLQQVQNFDNKINNLIPKFDKVDEQSKQMTDQALKIEQQSEQHYKLFDHKISAIGEAQQSLIKPFEIHLKQLEERIQSLNHDSVKQQAVCSGDKEKLTELSASVARFDETLQQSQDELKQHIQLLREPDSEANSEQFNQVSKQLEQLAQQLADVEDQSSALQTQLKQLQEQQSSTAEHHDELSRQYLNQQQQLQHHDNQLASAQNSLLSIDETLQSNLSSLTRNLDTEHARNQQKINEIESLQQEQKSHQQDFLKSHQQEQKSHQQEQKSLQQELKSHQQELKSHQQELKSHQQDFLKSHQQKQKNLQQAQENQQQQQAATLTQLGEQIKTRSQLFSIGLITVLAVSGLLFFSQETAESESEKQARIAQAAHQGCHQVNNMHSQGLHTGNARKLVVISF